MLQLINVCKSYTTADFTQTALDHVSVAFRLGQDHHAQHHRRP